MTPTPEPPPRPNPQTAPESSSQSTPPNAPDPLTEEWVRWIASKLSGCRVDPDVDIIVQHRVTATDGGEFCWYVRVYGGQAAAAAGLAEGVGSDPGRLTFTSDRETAWAIAADGASAQRAFLEGRLRLDGDARLLISARPALDALGAALAPPS